MLALDNVSLQIEPGQFVAVVGPSGCGKSTLLKIAAGLLAATRGDVRIDDTLVTSPYTELGIVFQTDLLLDWRTSLENVLLQVELRRLRKADYEDRALELLDLVGLGDFAHKYPRELSGGMRQRVSICRALVHDPSILLMDEPFGALDALTREELNLDLARLSSNQDKTVLFITHNIEEAVFLGDRVVVMSPRPGSIIRDELITLPRPRAVSLRSDAQFHHYVDAIRETLFSHREIAQHAPDEATRESERA